MRRLYLLAISVVLALVPEHGFADVIVRPMPEPTGTPRAELMPMPVPPVVTAPAPSAACGCTTAAKHEKRCLSRICEWVCYQPLKRTKCCKLQPMPCGPTPLYTFFPCEDCGTPHTYAVAPCACHR
jgi:hypothetical protein